MTTTDAIATPVPLEWMLILSGILFAIGMVGVLTRRNVLVIFMSVELMMNAVNISLVAFGTALNSLAGQAFVVFVVTVAAAEAAVGLAIIIALFRHRQTVNLSSINLLKG
jgi:NADH-quinone oxidoreductase subunit K